MTITQQNAPTSPSEVNIVRHTASAAGLIPSQTATVMPCAGSKSRHCPSKPGRVEYGRDGEPVHVTLPLGFQRCCVRSVRYALPAGYALAPVTDQTWRCDKEFSRIDVVKV